MSTKIAFPRSEETLEVSELGIPDAPGVTFTFWKNPSKPVVKCLIDIVMSSVEELSNKPAHEMARLEKEYYESLCLLIVDTNIDSLDFSTPEAAMKSFEAPDVPAGFVYQVVVSYLRRLLVFNEHIKKVVALYLIGSSSGQGSATKREEELTKTSSTAQNES